MRKQGLLFDSRKAMDAKSSSMDAVERNTLLSSKEIILDAIRAVPVGTEFTTDSVWMVIPESVRQEIEPRVLGPLMTIAAKRRLISRTDRVENSTMVSCHARPKRIWIRNNSG